MFVMRGGRRVYRLCSLKAISAAGSAPEVLGHEAACARSTTTSSIIAVDSRVTYPQARQKLAELKAFDIGTGRVEFSSGADGLLNHILKQVPITVGSVVKLKFLGTKGKVDVRVSSNLEEVAFEATLHHELFHTDWSLFDLSSENGTLVLTEARDTKELGLVALLTTIPERWCSLDVEAGEGDVFIQKLREGSLRLRTTGGNIQLGELKATTAEIDSGGGSLNAENLSAIANVKTGGGNVRVNRAFGARWKIDSGGGDIEVATLYGDDVVVSSHGGSIVLNHAQASTLLDVSSDGGAATIGGLEGKAKIVTNGGNVELQLHEHAREVEIQCGNGSVTLYLSNKLFTKLEYHGSGIYMQDAKMYKLESGQECGHLTFPAEDDPITEESDQARNKIEGPAECEVKVFCSGVLRVEKRNWVESVTRDSYFI